MSVSAMATYPNEKSFSRGYDDLDADFFDQFLTYSPVEDEEPDFSLLPPSTFLGSSISDENSAGTCSDSLDEDGKVQDHWLGESWIIPQDPASLHQNSDLDNHFYSEMTGRAALSDSELLSLEGITLQSPRTNAYSHPSLPSSPSPAVTAFSRKKRQVVETFSRKVKKVAGSIEKALRSPIRKVTSSPKMLRNQNNSDIWEQKLDSSKFKDDLEQATECLSSPPSAIIPDTPEMLDPISVMTTNVEYRRQQSYNDRMLQHNNTAPENYETPMTTPLLDTESSRKTSSQQRLLDSMDFPPTPQHDQVSNIWSQLPGSSEFNAYGTPTMYGPEVDPPLWWNHAAAAPMAQPSPTALHINPQRATKSLALHLQNEVSYSANGRAYLPPNMASGLMIQMPSSPPQQSFVVQSSPIQQQGYFSPTQPQFHARPRKFAQPPSNYPQQSSPIRKPRSSSSDSEGPSPKSSPAFHVRKRKNAKGKRHSEPRTPTLGGAVDFVNYTPDDSRKILTGVAPSGSSKTKARREKEAMDKRRKLSQAAVRAVRAAGGNVESLVEEGLFV